MANKIFSIPTFSRFLIILQLCFGFSAALYFLGYPFTGGLFKFKSDLLIIESVLGHHSTLFHLDPEKKEQLKEKEPIQQFFFATLPEKDRFHIQKLYSERQAMLQKPFSEKVLEGFLLFGKLPKLELLWVALAVVLPICLLLRNARALPFIWLFPLIALGYAWNNQTQGSDPFYVFPKESEVLAGKFSSKEEWEASWNRYLVIHYAKEKPSESQEVFHVQAIKGEFFFNLERLKFLSDDLSASFWEKRSLFLLLMYVVWNFYFAMKVYRSCG